MSDLPAPDVSSIDACRELFHSLLRQYDALSLPVSKPDKRLSREEYDRVINTNNALFMFGEVYDLDDDDTAVAMSTLTAYCIFEVLPRSACTAAITSALMTMRHHRNFPSHPITRGLH